MTSLVSLEDVQVRLKTGDSIPPGTESLLLQLMDFVTLQIAEYLRVGSFDAYTDRVDDYYVDSHRLKPFRLGYPSLLLSRGFVSVLTSITNGLTYSDIAGATVDVTHYKTDMEKGHVQVLGADFATVSPNRLSQAQYDVEYLRVTYSGGFAASSGVYKSVPSWLQSIALAVLADIWAATNGCEDGNCLEKCGVAVNRYGSLLDSYMRFSPESYDPL